MDNFAIGESFYFFVKSIILFLLYFFLFAGVSSFIIYFLLFLTLLVFLYEEKGSILKRGEKLFARYIEGIYKYKFIGIIPLIFFISYSIPFLFIPLYVVSFLILLFFIFSIREDAFLKDKITLKIGTSLQNQNLQFRDLVKYTPFNFSIVKTTNSVYETISIKLSDRAYVQDVFKRYYPDISIAIDDTKEKFLYRKIVLTSIHNNYFKYLLSLLNEDVPFSVSLHLLNPFKDKNTCLGFIILYANDKQFLERLQKIFSGTMHSLYIKQDSISNIIDIITDSDCKRDTILPVPDILPPTKFFEIGGLCIGESGGKEVFMQDSLRETHSYISGKSGTGKSTFMANIVCDDIKNGKSVLVIDPHDLTERILKKTDKSMVTVINPRDRKYSFNPLNLKNKEDISYMVDSIASVFHSLYREFWGPQSDDILRRSLRALILSDKNFTLLDLEEFLTDDHARILILNDIDDEDVKSYFSNIYSRWDQRSRNEKIAPLLNKLGRIKGDENLGHFLSNNEESLDLENLINSKTNIIFNLSKSEIGDENSKFLGSLMLSFIQIFILRKNPSMIKYIYIDEFQNFLTDSLVFLFSESRKFGVSITLANQYVTQIDMKYQDTILENVGIFYIFSEGEKSRKILKDIIKFEIPNVPKYFCFVKALDNPVFSIRTDE
ncbi:ATP-binding protein [Patescibacteria group bacterium]|nr:ATP-binding protein [Patescibacteria group bacterium]